MKIGFIGLGNMGLPMARNLMKAGHQLTVYNRTPQKAQSLQADGAKVAATPAEAATAAEAVITMLADDAALEAAVSGKDGILQALPSGAVHVGMSTISVELSRRLGKLHAEHSQTYCAAPVFGRPQAAEAAKLFVVAAGAAETLERCAPIFSAVGQKTFVAGHEPSQANLVKLSGNFLIVAMMGSLSQAMALVRKHGIEATQWLDLMTEALFPAPIYKNYGGMMAREQFTPAGFRLLLGLKDVHLVLEAAERAAVPMPIASAVRDDLIAGVARGWGDDDWSSLARVASERAGLPAAGKA
jgi:3-hydroxyisobutyrate dehydrogenase-like beta-hydroxyacid dehydrogenase